MSAADLPKPMGRFRWIAGMITGIFGIAFAVFGCYRAITWPFLFAETAVRNAKEYWRPLPASLPPGSIPTHLGWLYLGVVFGPCFDLVVCSICAWTCIYMTRRRILGWIIGLSGVAIAIAAWPLGQWALRAVMAKYHIVDVG